MAIKRVSLSWVGVKDFKKSKDFFTTILGLKVFEENENYGWLELSAPKDKATLGVCKAFEDSHPRGVNAIVTFVVDKFDETKSELESKGVKFFNEIIAENVPRMISFRDPDGNLFQLVEEESK